MAPLVEVDGSSTTAQLLVCGECDFRLHIPILRLRTSTLGLYNDARFPGRCLLVFHGAHVENLEDLDEETGQRYLADIRDASMAIRSVVPAPKVNIALLGNTLSHLHAHLIPRRPDAEPRPHRPIWEDPRPLITMPRDEATKIAQSIRKEIPRSLDSEGLRSSRSPSGRRRKIPRALYLRRSKLRVSQNLGA